MATTILLPDSITLTLQSLCISDATWYSPFSVWTTSVSITPSKSVHMVTNGRMSFFLCYPVCAGHIFFIWSPTVRLSGSSLLRIMLPWTRECRYHFKTVTPFPLNAHLEVELDHMIVLFLVFGALSVLFFHGSCINLHSHQQCTTVSFSLSPCQHLWFVVFLMTAILTGVRPHLMVLTCISLMMSDTEHLTVYLMAICVS